MSEGLVVFVTQGGVFRFDGMIQAGPQEQSCTTCCARYRRRTLAPSPTGIDSGNLCSLRLAHQRAKQVVEGSDGDIDCIIWSVRANCGQVSNKLLKEFPALTDEGLVAEFVVAIRRRL